MLGGKANAQRTDNFPLQWKAWLVEAREVLLATGSGGIGWSISARLLGAVQPSFVYKHFGGWWGPRHVNGA